MSAGGSTSIKKTITTACAYPLPKKNGWNSPKTSFRSVKGPIASPRRKSSSKCDLRTLRRNVRRPTSSAQRLTGHDVDEHLTRIGRVEAVEEFRERGLTRVARADQMQSLRSGTVRTIPQPCCNPVTRKKTSMKVRFQPVHRAKKARRAFAGRAFDRYRSGVRSGNGRLPDVP